MSGNSLPCSTGDKHYDLDLEFKQLLSIVLFISTKIKYTETNLI